MAPVYKFSNAGFLGRTYKSVLAENSVFAPIPPAPYDLLEATVLTGPQASITFSNLISTYGSDYQHLQIRMSHRTSANLGGGGDATKLQFNADTNNNYDVFTVTGFNNNVYVNSENSGIDSIYIQRGGDAQAAANGYGAAVIEIADAFHTSKYKTVRYIGGQPFNADYVFSNSGRWKNTAAIDSIKLFPYSASSYVSGTRISLYGWKAA